MRWMWLLVACFELAGSAAAADALLRVTPDSLHRLHACEALRSSKRHGELRTYAAMAKDDSRRQVDVVKECGFASVHQYEALTVRVSIAASDAMELEELREHPEALDPAAETRDEAKWAEQLKRGDIDAAELGHRREVAKQVRTLLRRAADHQARLKANPPNALDATGLLAPEDEQLLAGSLDAQVRAGVLARAQADAQLAEFRSGRAAIAQEAARQPPLGVGELAALQKK